MKNNIITKSWMAAICLMGALASITSAQAATKVEASLDREKMSTDDQAVLTIVVSGDQKARISLPKVDGVQFRPAGNSSSMRVINGQVSVTVEQRVILHATKPGDYVIPPVRALSDSGVNLSASSLKLSVSKGSGRRVSRGSGSIAPAPHMPRATLGQGAGESGNTDDFAFLEVIPAKKNVVVGEFVPVEIHAYFRAGERISLRSLPKVSGGGFVLKNQDGKPKQKAVEKDGVPYTRLTFYAGISAIKPGEFPVEVSLDATVMVREKGGSNPMRSMRSRMGSIFGGGMLDDFFSRLVEKEVMLTTDPIPVTVVELPQQGKPIGFSGAIGNFTAMSSAAESSVKTGDPVTVEVAISGKGNFSRVTMPKLADKKHWKVYPSSHEFAAADVIGQAGAKVFKQVIVPLSPDVTEVPSFELSYYNPESKSFEITRSEPISLRVSGAAISTTSLTAQDAAAPTPEEGGDTEQTIQQGESPVGTLAATPLYARSWFLVLQVLAFLAILVAVLIQVVRKITRNPERVASQSLQRSLKRVSVEMDQAIAKNDTVAFFDSLRLMLQTYVGRKLGIVPAAVTVADVRDTEIRELLTAADTVAFSGQAIASSELESWKTRALSVMAGN